MGHLSLRGGEQIVLSYKAMFINKKNNLNKVLNESAILLIVFWPENIKLP